MSGLCCCLGTQVATYWSLPWSCWWQNYPQPSCISCHPWTAASSWPTGLLLLPGNHHWLFHLLESILAIAFGGYCFPNSGLDENILKIKVRHTFKIGHEIVFETQTKISFRSFMFRLLSWREKQRCKRRCI